MSRVLWEWDETLYAGSAPHYVVGRMPYPPEIVDVLRGQYGFDGTGRLLDVGCGPGSLTLLLAPLFVSVVGIDADPDMLAQAQQAARRVGVANASWYRMRAEALPADLGTFRVVTFAQSFHWVDRPRVAGLVRSMLEPDGVWVHVHASTHQGVPGDDPLPRPRPPRDEIASLVAEFVGPIRRAGRHLLPGGTPDGEEDIMRAAGYRAPVSIEVGGGSIVERTEDEVVSSVFSLSSSAPHLFGERRPEFEQRLRALLRAASPGGLFSELTRPVLLVIWRP